MLGGVAFVRAAYFTVGAAVGAGSVALYKLKRSLSYASGTTCAQPPAELEPNSSAKVELQTAPALAETTQRITGTILKYGDPGPISDFLVRKAYVTAYDRRLRHPLWTAEHLTLSSLGRSRLNNLGAETEEKGDRSRAKFAEDRSIPMLFRAKLQDYFRSGYDRGHMVPAADARESQEAMDETFLLTNIAPQVGVNFNRHYWSYVEDWCRRLTGTFSDVFVFTVPLYLPKQCGDGKFRVAYEVIGSPPNVSVPTHFAKVILASKPSSSQNLNALEISTGAFVLPNAEIPDETPFESFAVSVDSVERAAGLMLFSDAIKTSSKHICKTSSCNLLIRRFENTQQKLKSVSLVNSITTPS